MSNLLSFTLGLSAGGFTKGIQHAGGELKAFMGHAAKFTGVGAAIAGAIGSFEAMGNVVEGVMAQIEKGAGLEKLSKTTGETVGNLFSLQKAIASAGGDAESAGNMVFMLSKALGGINAEGEPVAGIFAQIGLSIADLKALSAPGAIQAIAKSINRLDNASAAFAAGKIFGRSQAQSFLAIARGSNEFAEGLEKSAGAASVMERNAATFEKIEKSMRQIKGLSSKLYLGIAAGLGPGIELIMEQVNKIDFAPIGEKLGIALGGFIEAFREGRFGEILALSLKTGFDIFAAYFQAAWNSMGDIMANALLRASSKAMDFLSNHPAFRLLMVGINPAMGLSLAASTAAYTADKGNQLPLQSWAEVFKGINENFTEALGKSGSALKTLFDTLVPLNNRLPRVTTDATRGKASNQLQLGSEYHVPRTDLEKMGFSFRSGVGGSDAATQTARNTGKMVNLLSRLALGAGSNFSQANPWVNQFA